MFPGVHWSWKLQEIVIRREVAAREGEQPSRMKAAALLCTLEPILLGAGSESQSRRPLTTPLLPPYYRLLPSPLVLPAILQAASCFVPHWFCHLNDFFCQYGPQKHCSSVKILHMKFIPLTTFHKMWSQFLFLFLIMKVKPGSLNFYVMERSKFVALFPFSTPPPLPGTRYPHHIPQAVAPFRNGIAVRLQREGKGFY